MQRAALADIDIPTDSIFMLTRVLRFEQNAEDCRSVATSCVSSGTVWIGIRRDFSYLAILGLLTGSFGLRADWPMFRGDPQLSGVTTNALPDKLKLSWSVETGGPVTSTAAIVGESVYIGSYDKKIYALNLKDGSKRWTFETSGAIEASPLFLNGRLYIGDTHTNFYCLDATQGTEIWRTGFDDKIISSANYFVPPDSTQTNIIVGCYDFKLYSLDADTGKVQWSYETGNYINGSPAVADGKTAFGGCDAIVHVVNLKTGELAAEVDIGAYIIGSAALLNGRAYIGHYENAFISVDLEKKEVAWSYRDRAFPYASSPAVTANHVVFGGRDRRVHSVKRDTGEPEWTFMTRGRVESSPVVTGNRVVVGSDDGRVYLLDLEKGREIWQYEIGEPVQSSPAVAQGRLVIGSSDGRVYCFGGE
jgi:outer membrane protein assembly factor BamB